MIISSPLMCAVLEIHRSMYYKHRHQIASNYPDYQMMNGWHKKTLGYRRMTQALATELGVIMNHKKVIRVMTKFGLR
jgi:hypothetical protein